MTTLAIDPGTSKSQYVLLTEDRVVEHGFSDNLDLLYSIPDLVAKADAVCIEGVASYGMAVGREVFETCIWIGRFIQQSSGAGKLPQIVYRQAVKLHLCHSPKAKDANVRQALIDRYGGKEAAIGRKKAPGPLYGIASHGWAALALAVTFSDQNRQAA